MKPRLKPELWWVIADEPNGRMSYLKGECRSYMDASKMMTLLRKNEPKLRYRLLQIY